MVYNGKALSTWIDDYWHELAPFTPPNAQSKEKQENALQAVQHIGTNALPFLMEEMRSTDSVIKTKTYLWATKQHLFKIPMWPGFLRHQRAKIGFRMLGPRAQSVVPELIALLQSTNTKWYYKCDIEEILGSIGADAKAAVPTLTGFLSSTNEWLRRDAAMTLGKIGTDAELVIPALLANIGHTNGEVRYRVVGAIGKFGDRAQKVCPEVEQSLRSALKDSNQDVREAAEKALKQIGCP